MSRKYLTKELVSRQSQYSFFRHIGMLPNPDKILGRTGKTIEAYRDLKNDPHVWSCIQSRKSGLLAMDWELNPGDASEPVAREIRNILDDLDIQNILREILETPLFGYQPMEAVWQGTSGKRKFIVPEDIIAKPQEWFLYDTKGRLRFRIDGKPEGALPPPYKILDLKYEASYQNPYGHALLGKCYWPVTFKNGGMRFWVNFMERYGMPMLIGQYNRGTTFEESEKLARELAGMTEDSVIVAPSDIDITMQEAARTSSVDLYKELIKNCNAEISKALLSQTLTTELDMGSYAASQTHYKIRREVIRSDIRIVEKAMNTVIKWIAELNFQSRELPKFRIRQDESENESRIERDLKIAQAAGLKFSKEYWMRTYGFRDDDIESEAGK